MGEISPSGPGWHHPEATPRLLRALVRLPMKLQKCFSINRVQKAAIKGRIHKSFVILILHLPAACARFQLLERLTGRTIRPVATPPGSLAALEERNASGGVQSGKLFTTGKVLPGTKKFFEQVRNSALPLHQSLVPAFSRFPAQHKIRIENLVKLTDHECMLKQICSSL